jgi:type II secretory pathway component PulK
MVAKQSVFRASPSQREGAGRGFALVTTLTIMALLSIVMFGVLSLSTVTVRSSSAGRFELEAKANARPPLALLGGPLLIWISWPVRS